jgi:hypothetical protein
MEVEYIAASEATKEVVWINFFVSELGVVPSASRPMDLYCGNSVIIAQAKEPGSQKVQTCTTTLSSHLQNC